MINDEVGYTFSKYLVCNPPPSDKGNDCDVKLFRWALRRWKRRGGEEENCCDDSRIFPRIVTECSINVLCVQIFDDELYIILPMARDTVLLPEGWTGHCDVIESAKKIG